ncbi:MAG TPA: S9 family peptidase, partial [Allosphingosinicella sp.]|nr:S9 family peptidase [Allosphingosinicella sp.]
MKLVVAAAMLAAGTAPAQQPAAPAPARRPVEHFAALPFMEEPSLSPDGAKVAAKVAARGKQFLAVVPLGQQRGQPKLMASGRYDINWWRWVNDEWLVVGIGTVQSVAGQDFYVTRAIGVSADLATINPLGAREAGQNADDLLWTASDGTPRILLAQQTSIYFSDEGFWPEVVEIDVATRKSRR